MDFSAVLCRILRLSYESLASPLGEANVFWCSAAGVPGAPERLSSRT
jgi:hypothetical protein